MYLTRVLGEAAAEIRDVLRAGTPTHSRLRDRLAVAAATVGFGAFLIKRGEEIDAAKHA